MVKLNQDLIRAYDMLPDEGLVLCAVSGGADSMCLLTWLLELSCKSGFTVAAAHYNHALRGAEAQRDEAFVRDYCREHGIPFYGGRGDVASAAREHGWSVEEAGRNLRYAFLEETARQTGAVRIATAHNRGDNAETVLMNLIRGTGLTGLAGIPPVRGILIRPLLETGREEIEAYLAEHGVPHVEDRSNESAVYTRNRLRHEILPALREVNPRAEESIAKTAALLRQDEAYLNAAAERVCRRVRCAEGRALLERAALTELPPALQGRVVRRMLDLLGVSKKDVTARHIRAILELVRKSGPTAQLSLPRGVAAQNVYEEFQLTASSIVPWERTLLPPVGEVCAGPWRIFCRVGCRAEPGENRLILNNAAIDAPVAVDRWRQDGRMTLPGQEGSRSLKRLFVDAGCSVARREETPVVYVGTRVAAALGVGVDCAFAAREDQMNYILDFQKR